MGGFPHLAFEPLRPTARAYIFRLGAARAHGERGLRPLEMLLSLAARDNHASASQALFGQKSPHGGGRSPRGRGLPSYPPKLAPACPRRASAPAQG